MFDRNNNEQLQALEVDHRAFAFMAAREGNVKFLEALLGPSIPKEKERAAFLSTQLESSHVESQLCNFQIKIIESQLTILTKFKKDSDNIEVLQKALDDNIADLLERSVEAEVDRMSVHSQAYFGADQPLYPDISYLGLGVANQISPVTMTDFFSRWENIKPDANGIYCVPLNEDIVSQLKHLWLNRYTPLADKLHAKGVSLETIPVLKKRFSLMLDGTVAILEAISKAKKPIADEYAKLSDELYYPRRIRFAELVQELADNPDDLVLAYCKDMTQLPRLLKRAKVSVDSVDKEGNTLLHVATKNMKFSTVKFLLERDPNLGLRNREGRTAAELYNISDEELKQVAKIYKFRHESKFLEDVTRDLEAYKKAFEQAKTSLRKYFHTKQKREERARQIEKIEREISLTKDLPTDEVLVHRILMQNLEASRGKLGRSSLFDPLVERVKHFIEEKGYGVSSQDVRELLGKEPSAVVEMQLREQNAQKDAMIMELNQRLAASEDEKMELYRRIEISQADNESIKMLTQRLEESDNANKLLQANFNERVEQRVAEQGRKLAFILSRMNINPQELPPIMPQPEQSMPVLANNPAALFGSALPEAVEMPGAHPIALEGQPQDPLNTARLG
ncbi:MAG TPA: hypothetical protein VFU82_06255 [Gammaproteobacteria bacterium]|nr:hypothetical protein [Gammaproteobacteria bacterium]